MIDYDNYFGKGGDDTMSKTSGSSTKVATPIEEILKGIAKKMQPLYGPLRAIDRCMDRPYICGVCGKNHPTSQCIPKIQGCARLETQIALWCDFHKKWGKYLIENFCYHIHHIK